MLFKTKKCDLWFALELYWMNFEYHGGGIVFLEKLRVWSFACALAWLHDINAKVLWFYVIWFLRFILEKIFLFWKQQTKLFQSLFTFLSILKNHFPMMLKNFSWSTEKIHGSFSSLHAIKWWSVDKLSSSLFNYDLQKQNSSPILNIFEKSDFFR